MKQVPITGDILTRLQAAAGADVDVSNFAVFEATALNTLPVRKNHPLYKNGTHTRAFLNDMQKKLSGESLPLQIMHDSEPLPIGRIFFGEVLDGAEMSELRSLFWIDKTHTDAINLVNNGTVDQVSVSVLPKTAKCNLCGFDFLGPKATYENIWSGACDDGHVMGDGAAHVTMDALDNWFEMSLVGQGGIPGATIKSRTGSHFSDQRLAASGLDASMLTLTLSSSDQEPPKMDLAALIAKTEENAVKIATLTAEKAAADAKVVELTALVGTKDAEIATLTASNAGVAEKDTKITALEAEVVELSTAVVDTTKHVLALKGDATTQVADAKAALPLLKEVTASMKLSFGGAAGRSADAGANQPVLKASNAFKRAI